LGYGGGKKQEGKGQRIQKSKARVKRVTCDLGQQREDYGGDRRGAIRLSFFFQRKGKYFSLKKIHG